MCGRVMLAYVPHNENQCNMQQQQQEQEQAKVQQKEQEKPPLSKEEQMQQLKVLVCSARKMRVHAVTNSVDFKLRLSKFDGNEYRPQPSNYYSTGVVFQN